MLPKVLLVTTVRWFATARLAAVLTDLGCELDALCPAGHPIETVPGLHRTYRFHSIRPERSLRLAISRSRPTLVVPGDDLASFWLHRFYRTCKDDTLQSLIEGSLGRVGSFRIVRSRARMIEVARHLGICAPETVALRSVADLKAWIKKKDFPLILKADGTYGGRGVRVAATEAEAGRAFLALGAPPSFRRTVKRALVNRDGNYLPSWFTQRRARVSVQQYIHGEDANSMVACWKGEVLAAINVRVVQHSGPTGPASVICVIDDRDMEDAARRLVRHLGLSGFVGFDFVREHETGRPHLIELNPRPTQIGHLLLGAERDLTAALCEAVAGRPVERRPCQTTNPLIALFPQEWMRDQQSEYFERAYHDVPWNAPRLARAATARDWRVDAWSLVSSSATGMTDIARRPMSLAARIRRRPFSELSHLSSPERT